MKNPSSFIRRDVELSALAECDVEGGMNDVSLSGS